MNDPTARAASWVIETQNTADMETREVYALAGLALFEAQCLELEIVNSLGLAEIVNIWRTSRPQSSVEMSEYSAKIDQIWDKNYERTLGQLLISLRQSGLVIPNTLDSLLRESLENRNRLVHGYFRERSKWLFDSDGRRSMANDLRAMQELFGKTDHSLSEVTSKIRNALGMSAENIKLVGELMKANASETEIARVISTFMGEVR